MQPEVFKVEPKETKPGLFTWTKELSVLKPGLYKLDCQSIGNDKDKEVSVIQLISELNKEVFLYPGYYMLGGGIEIKEV